MTKRELTRLLKSLGKTADEVAATLRRARCRGECGDEFTCPVANYVTRKAKSQASVSLGWIDIKAAKFELPTLSVKTPRAIQLFTRLFDSGLYPELVRKTRVAK